MQFPKLNLTNIAQLTGHNGSIFCMDVQKQLAISAGADGWVVQWEPLINEKGMLLAKCEEPIYCIKKSNETIFAGSASGHIYCIYEDKTIRKIQAHTKGVFFILPILNGFLTGGGDGCLLHWDLQWNVLQTQKVSMHSLRAICIWQNGWAIASSDGNVYTFNNKKQLENRFSGHSNSLFSIISNKTHFWTGGRNALLSKHNGLDWEYKIAGHTLHIHGLALHPTLPIIASSSMDKSVKIWEFNGSLLKVIDKSKLAFHTNCINAIAWLNVDTILTCSDDRTLRVTKILGLV